MHHYTNADTHVPAPYFTAHHHVTRNYWYQRCCCDVVERIPHCEIFRSSRGGGGGAFACQRERRGGLK